ncbi:Hypothetical protein GLP15_1241 [Giardia lamblia P15]|uniref:Lysosomal dipeptide transporter MFSD1 n=1 Tax=Giardia intestinalis (strain P15) TaxID=658858 RepID=E1EZS0_GIAIA|nr:Hypothetical protein GLP15_1241 [Giardia lamblia P15]
MDELASFMPLRRRSRCTEGTLIVIHIFFISITLIPVNIFASSSNPLSKLIIDTFQRQDIISLTATINSVQCFFSTFLVSFFIDTFGPQYFLVPIHALQLLCAIACAFCTTATQFIIIQFVSGLSGEAVIMAQARLMQYFIPFHWQPVGFGLIFASVMLGHTLASIVIGSMNNLRVAYLSCACLIFFSTVLGAIYTFLEVRRKYFEDLLNEYVAIADLQRQSMLANVELNTPFPETLPETQSNTEHTKISISVSSTKYNKTLLSQFAIPHSRSRNWNSSDKGEISTKLPSQMFIHSEIMMYLDNPDVSISDISTLRSFEGSVTYVMETEETMEITICGESSPLYDKKIIYQLPSRRTRRCTCQRCKELFLSSLISIKEAPLALFMVMIPRILVIGAVGTFNATSVLSLSSILSIRNEDAILAVGLSQLLSSIVLFMSGLLSRLSYFGPIFFVLIGTIMYTITQVTLYILGKVEKFHTALSAQVLMSFLGISIGFFAANFAFVIATLAGRKIPATSLGLVFSLQYVISSVFIPVVRYISTKFDYRQTCWVIIGLFSLGIPFIIYGTVAIARLNPRLISKIPITIPEPHKVSVKVLRPEDEALIRENESSRVIQNDQKSEDGM